MKNNKDIHARTCIYNINYHIVWCVKYRRKVFTPQISNRLYELVNRIADEKGFTVVECKVGEGESTLFCVGSTEDFCYSNSKIPKGN